MKCGRCGFFAECEESGRDPDVCDDYDETDMDRREEREAHEVDKADAKRKGYD